MKRGDIVKYKKAGNIRRCRGWIGVIMGHHPRLARRYIVFWSNSGVQMPVWAKNLVVLNEVA
jgi:hypothetical protein